MKKLDVSNLSDLLRIAFAAGVGEGRPIEQQPHGSQPGRI